jgi:alkaline phosphatase
MLWSRLSLVLLLSLGCSGQAAPDDTTGGKADDIGGELPAQLPKRVILLIGDGMGPSHISGAAYLADRPLRMLQMEHFGFQATHEHEYVTTDSAASASAMASGHKTHFEGVGVLPGTDSSSETDPDQHFDTVIDAAQRVEWKTGLVVTTALTDATPAGFGAHRAKRKSKDGIAEDMRHSGIDVLLGGGSSWFEDRGDGQNLLSQLRNDGYSVAHTRTGLRKVANKAEKVIGVFSEKDMPALQTGERPIALAEMTEHALKVLDRDNDDGFFLMVEGSWIDRESHTLDAPASLAEVIDFDDAVGVALDYAAGRDDTLVVVTADHETGGLAIVDSSSAQAHIDALGGDAAAEALAAFPNSDGPPPFERLPLGGALGPADGELVTSYGHMSVASRPFFGGPFFAFRGSHSATAVPVFASGPAAEFVARMRDNADLGAVLKRIILEDGSARGSDPAPPVQVPENVIVVMTDGVGLPTLSAGQYASGLTSYRDFPSVGLVATHSADALVSDLGAAATALSSGTPAEQGEIGGPLVRRGWFDLADESGLDTALVTTADLSNAAIASLSSHEDDSDAPLLQLARMGEAAGTDGFDVVFGGGRAGYSDADLDEWRTRGAVVENSWSPIVTGSGPIVRLLADGALPPASERLRGMGPTLAEMTRTALEHLEDRGNPFLLTVYAEGVRRAVDEQSHEAAMLDELSDLDATLREALAAAARIGDTAVVLVSLRDSTVSLIDNHYAFHKQHCGVAIRCGGTEELVDLPVAVGEIHNSEGFSDVALQGDFSPIGVILQYAWHAQETGPIADASSASATLTPLLATGPGADSLRGFHSLAEVGEVVASWLTH